MRNNGNPAPHQPEERTEAEPETLRIPVPAPTASFRRRAWIEFQRALDPLAPVRPLPPRRH